MRIRNGYKRIKLRSIFCCCRIFSGGLEAIVREKEGELQGEILSIPQIEHFFRLLQNKGYIARAAVDHT